MRADLLALVLALPPRPTMPAPWPDEGETHAAWSAEVERRRAAFEQAAGAQSVPDPGSQVERHSLPCPDGELGVRVYRPTGGTPPYPVVVTLHGGGFWLGGGAVGMTANAAGCRLMCERLEAIVVDVDYRTPPEHRFPAALEDAWAATTWAAALPDADADRLALSGPSAGGNLVAGVARLSRERGPRIALQQLLVPTLDATLASPSVAKAFADGETLPTDLTGSELATCWELYLGPHADPRDVRASPLLAEDLAGLPPAHVVVGEHDPLRDDGLLYAERLEAAGVPVVLDRFEMTHYLQTPDITELYVGTVLMQLAEALAP